MGLHADTMMTFGKFGPGADHRPIGHVPASYLRWCLEQDWFEDKHEDLIEIFQEELNWREQWDVKDDDEGWRYY